MRTHAALSRLLILSTLLALVPPAPRRVSAQEAEGTKAGLRFRLSGGEGDAPTPEAAGRVAAAEPLSDAEARALLARLPPLAEDAGDAQDFRLGEGAPPPPRAGRELSAAFAPPAVPSGPPAAPLSPAPLGVLRVAPEGEVELAPSVSVTFSQPMVPAASQAEAERGVPAVLTPQTRGRGRWLSAQTLLFQPETEGGRLPAATSYSVRIPAGTRSALGNALPAARSFTFTTPPPALKRTHPEGEGLPRDPVIFMEFDQRVDAARVLRLLKLEPGGVRLRAATAEEIAADKRVAELVRSSQEGRWLAVRAVGPGGSTEDALPAGTTVRVLVPPGTPSAEGPRTTHARQEFSFKTYGALRVVKSACEAKGRCRPFEDFTLTLSNPLDARAFRPSQVLVTPDTPGLKVSAEGEEIRISGAKRADTTYAVTLDRSLRDLRGQTLAGRNSFAFRVGREEPSLYADGEGFVVLDPAARRVYTVYSVNLRRLKVSLYKVAPEDWPHFRAYQTARYNRPPGAGTGEALRPPGTLLSERVVSVSGAAADQLVETQIDLSPVLTNGYGQAFVRVEPVREDGEPVRVYAYGDGRAEAWLQATDIGLDAFADGRTLVAWASSLRDGGPLAGVRVSALPDGARGETGADGLARLALPTGSVGGHPYLVARRGDDVAVLPAASSPYDSSPRRWRTSEKREALRWYVFDDRRLYRPGEEVSVKGWIRKVDLTPEGDTELFAAAGRTLEYVLHDPGGNELSKGTARLNALAGFDLKLRLPESMGLGNTSLTFKLPGEEEHTHRFGVQAFRRPEFELTARASGAPHFVGSSAAVTAAAGYYAGGPLSDAQVRWDVRAEPADYTPPGRDDYTFGKFRPWWSSDYDDYYGGVTRQTFEGRTDAAGRHTLRIDFDSVTPARPSSVFVNVSTQDVNRQEVAASTQMLVHPSAAYVGLKPARTFVQKGRPFDVGLIVTDLDGRALPGREVRLRLARLEYVREEGEWVQREADAQEQTVASGADAVALRLPTREGGTYRLTARVRDERERPNETELTLWAAGGKLPPEGRVTEEEAQLIPDRRTYKGGDTAEILVQSPFAPAEGVLTLRRSGLLRTERFTMSEATHTLRVPLEEGWTPNVRVQVDLVGAAPRQDAEGRELSHLPPRPAFASGELNLELPPDARRLSVSAAPRDAVLEPGRETTVAVEVKDAAGRPVAGTDTAVVVVDESVLALTNYRLRDPLSVFYGEREAGAYDLHLRESVDLADPSRLGAGAGGGDIRIGGGGPGGGGGGFGPRSTLSLLQGVSSGVVNYARVESAEVSVVTRSGAGDEIGGGAINLRRNFDALAVFAASLPTDAAGRAEVKVRLPDSLTRYRVTAVSVAGGRLAGSGESAITARLPLMARPSAPRFLNFGDRAELPVVLQNQTGSELSVGVAVRAVNAELTEGQGRRVRVPANDRVEVRFPFAALRPGTARFQVAAASGDKTDAAEVSLPVYTPATTESFATYGVVDEGAVAQPVSAPAGVVPDFGGLEVTTSSTQLQELTDAFIYLQTYPYECGEQLASRVLSVVALKDVLAAFRAKELPPPERIRAAVASDLRRLEALQNDDGGFGFWRRGEPSDPYVSAHVAHALARAAREGFGLNSQTESKSRDYLRRIASKIPAHYGADSRRTIQAYALHARAAAGDNDPAAARKLVAEAGGAGRLPLEALGWLLPLLASDPASARELEAARRHLGNRVTETAGAAHFADSYSDGELTVLHSDRRADAVILEALIGDQPRSDLIPKLVRGLLAHRKRGRWENTQENVFALLALGRYFRAYESQTPAFVARIWLGEAFAGEQSFDGRDAGRRRLELPMALLAERTRGGPSRLTIGKEGAGRLYFRVGTRYAPSSLKLDAADYGFRVERTYEAVDDARDVRRDPEGTWRVRAGSRVRVRLRLLTPARRYHVALADPLPAGLEALNPELATTAPLPRDTLAAGARGPGAGATTRYRAWPGRWYDHQNLRDERAEAFASLLWEGEHEYTYFARATTPGAFVVPPPKAEEMYEPETFGRGPTDRLIVE